MQGRSGMLHLIIDSAEIFPFIKLKTFLVTDYAGFFIAGAACFLIRAHGLSRSRVVLLCASWALSLYHEFQLLPSFSEHFRLDLSPVVIGIVMTSFFVVLLGLALRRTPILHGSRWAWFGAVSYPLYLIHQNVGYMLFNLTDATANSDVLFWSVIAAAIAFALMVHVAVEKPLARPLRSGIVLGLDALHNWALTAQRSRMRQ
ncbi:acyltransferase 3 [Burkholderia vietnamiensis G4]|uniref:Acyltransferase 3 n=1 Tax=Burkholderia vietnamiensis (strain G4 / LMG 22486) TaxID=269482 RepID=A4JPL2_BURVG|nr:acyltransferase 3 [Burkholderia vietnamiensis G4]